MRWLAPGGTRRPKVPATRRGHVMQNRIALAAAFTIVLSASAFAQTAEEQNLCMNDAFRVCSHTIPDRGRTVACMVQNKTQLSQGCQMVMDKYAPPPPATASAAPAPAAAPVRTVKNA